MCNTSYRRQIILCGKSNLTIGAYHYIEYNTVKEIIITASKQGNYSIWRLKDDSLIFEKENALKSKKYIIFPTLMIVSWNWFLMLNE